MKNFAILLLFVAVLAASCKKVEVPDGTPRAIKKKIKDADENSTCPDVKVDEYKFQYEKVYVFEPGLCGADLSANVYDEDGKYLGFLGGYIGNTKINGESFENATFIRTVWKN